MKHSPFGFFLCLTFFCSLTLAALDAETGAALPQRLLRLHVLAASNDQTDQQRKLAVRDAILQTLAPALQDCQTLSQAEEAVETALPALEQAARDTLRQLGSEDSVTVSLSLEDYPLRVYPGFCLPAGRYRSLRVCIGPARGHNWWCVVFPTLCLSASEEEEAQALAAFSPAERRLLTGSGYIPRLKVLELWQKVKTRLSW